MQSTAVNQALSILKLLRQIMDEQQDADNKLNRIIKTIAEQTGSDAAACFIVINDKKLELFSSYGLQISESQKLSLAMHDTIIGETAQTCRTLCLPDYSKHSKFQTENEFGAKDFKGFLAIPLIRWNRAIGVLALYKKEVYEYSPFEQETLETIAMVLSDILSSEEMSAYKEKLIKKRGIVIADRIKGISLSKGYGIGHAVIHRRRQTITKIFTEDKDAELKRLEDAFTLMNKDLDEKFTSSKLGLGEHVDILDAYRMFAQDKGWYKKITGNVNSGLTAEAAVERAYEDMWNRLSGTTEQYLKERLHDLRDVSDRLQNYLRGENMTDNIQSENNNLIIVAQTMGPAELMDYDHTKIRGLIIEDGTPTMHVAIVAKALNIPVIAKVNGLYDGLKNGDLIAIDGNESYIYINPNKMIQARIQAKIAEISRLQQKLAELKKLPTISKDGKKIGLYINVGLSFDLDYLDSTGCDGVGLYRTEIPFMSSDNMPNVEQQMRYYQTLMDKAGDRKVVFRSLDVGSDKLLPYWGNMGEDNPAIGWRSIRITLDRRAILRKQLRAFLRASAGKELNVMFPMISNLSEFEDAKETLLIELEKEKRKSTEIPSKVNIGLMIEVPSVLFQLDEILPSADFVSIGTNDLAQFIFACDRGNPRLSERYDVLSAPFLRLMNEIITKANKADVLCSVCGEMASNPLEAMVLLGLGYRHLSVSGASYGRVKSMIRSANIEEISDYVHNLLKSPKKTLRPQLMAYAYDHGIEIY